MHLKCIFSTVASSTVTGCRVPGEARPAGGEFGPDPQADLALRPVEPPPLWPRARARRLER